MKKIGAIESLNLSNKIYELKQSIFPQNLMNDFIRAQLKELVSL